MWTTRRSQRRHRLYIVIDFYKKITSNLLIYFGCRTAAWQVIHSANIS